MNREQLSMDRLLRTCAQVAQLNEDEEPGDPDTQDQGREDRAVARVQVMLTPAARLALITELAQGLPGWGHATIHLHGSEAVSFAAGLPGAKPSTWVHGEFTDIGHYTDGAVSLFATERRPSTEEEKAALAAAPLRPETCLMLEATRAAG